MDTEIKKLRNGLNLCSSKNNENRSCTIVYSKSGKNYISGSVETTTNLLNFTSEQNALMISVLNRDYKVFKMVTMRESVNKVEVLSPIVLKFIIDYQIRTGNKVGYELLDATGNLIFSIKDLSKTFPLYNPELRLLKMVSSGIKISTNRIKVLLKRNLIKLLKEKAIDGINRNFPQYDNASGYGTSILTDSGKMYFGGQYSSFDKRIGFHSEMNTVISALMNMRGKDKITHLGIVSTKHPHSPCYPCGICRQFLSELSDRYNWDINVYCFAKDTDEFEVYDLNTLLPNKWTNKK